MNENISNIDAIINKDCYCTIESADGYKVKLRGYLSNASYTLDCKSIGLDLHFDMFFPLIGDMNSKNDKLHTTLNSLTCNSLLD